MVGFGTYMRCNLMFQHSRKPDREASSCKDYGTREETLTGREGEIVPHTFNILNGVVQEVPHRALTVQSAAVVPISISEHPGRPTNQPPERQFNRLPS